MKMAKYIMLYYLVFFVFGIHKSNVYQVLIKFFIFWSALSISCDAKL